MIQSNDENCTSDRGSITGGNSINIFEDSDMSENVDSSRTETKLGLEMYMT